MTSGLLPTVQPKVLVSWDGSADFTGPYDDVTGDTYADPGITVDEGRDGARTLNPPQIAAGDVELHNDDGAYSQENPQSPVYQRVIPGLPVAFQARRGERRLYRSHTRYREHVPYRGIGVWPLGRHIIDDISQTTEWGNRRVKLATLGYETVLMRATVSVPVMLNPRVDQCITALLDAAGWPPSMRAVSAADTTLLYWWCDERSPWDAMIELLAAEGPGTFYVDRGGVFHFEGRNFRTIAARSTTSQATFWDHNLGNRTGYRDHVLYRDDRLYRGRSSGLYFTTFAYDPGFKNIYNRVTYSTSRRALGAVSQVWNYGTSFTLASGQSRTLIARPNDPFLNAVAPLLGTDYTVSGGSVTVTLSSSSGLVAYIVVTATSGAPTVSGVTTPGLQLRAQPLTQASQTIIENNLDASASIAKFSPIPGRAIPNTLALNAWPEIDPSMAEGVCNAWVGRYMTPHPAVTITLRNADQAHVDQIVARMPSDRITLIESNTGMEADVWINSLTLKISGAAGRTVELVLGCEKVTDVGGAVWDLSVWDAPSSVWGV
jgi:hypothetical protein